MNNGAIHCQKQRTYDHSMFMAPQEVNTRQGFFRPHADAQHGRADCACNSNSAITGTISFNHKTANINKRGQEIFLDFRVKIRNPRATKYPFKSVK